MKDLGITAFPVQEFAARSALGRRELQKGRPLVCVKKKAEKTTNFIPFDQRRKRGKRRGGQDLLDQRGSAL